MPEFFKRNVIVFVYSALALSTLLVFWQVRNFDFVAYDDNAYVYENPQVLSGLTQAGVIWAFTTGCADNWHPVTWLSLMLDCRLFGANPGWMHLMNLFLHIANTLLLFAVLKKMTDSTPRLRSGQASSPQAGSLWPSAFVAAAFSLHPMHVESVAWIAERKDVLSTLLLLLTLAAYVNYVRRRGLFRYLLTLLLFALGLLAKPMLVTLPFLLLLLDYWPLNRFTAEHPSTSSGQAAETAHAVSLTGEKKNKINSACSAVSAVRLPGRLIIEKIPFLVLAGVSSVITFLVQRGAMPGIDVFPSKIKFANAVISYIRYIGKLFVPRNLAVFYPLDADGFPYRQTVFCVLLLLGISILAIYFGRKHRYLPVGWFWYVGTLVPVIGFVQVGVQSMADRYSYIPYIGLFIIIAWGSPELLSKWRHRKIVLGIAAVTALMAMGTGAYLQAGYWKNGIVLFTHAIEVTRDNHIAFNNLGDAYRYFDRYQDAIEAYNQAIKINPASADAYFCLGASYIILGRYEDAIESYRRAVSIKPHWADAHCNLGFAYLNLGRYQESIGPLEQAIRIEPDSTEAYNNLGVAFNKLGRWQESIDAFKRVISIKPDDAEAHYGLGVTYLTIGDKDSAFREYKILKTLGAIHADQLYNLIHK